MGEIFVAYGERDRRTEVLEFSVDQASSCGHDLVVYHIQESRSESVPEIRESIESVVQERDPFLVYEIRIDRLDDRDRKAAGSKRELLRNAVFEADRTFTYVVMGEIDRGPIEDIAHSSMTRAVLNEHSVPVVLIPV